MHVEDDIRNLSLIIQNRSSYTKEYDKCVEEYTVVLIDNDQLC